MKAHTLEKLNYIDLFAGAGGLSEGFAREGFRGVAYVEADIHACHTLNTRLAYRIHSKRKSLNQYYAYLKQELSKEDLWASIPSEVLNSVINEEISENSLKHIYSKIDYLLGSEKLNLLIGGPPCQAYSIVGRSRDPNRMVGDTRNFLFRFYAQFLGRYKPQFFVFENVLGLLTAGNEKYLNEMRKLFRKIGYETDFSVLNAEEFGVLQKRRRVVIIGRRGTGEFHFPILETVKNDWQIKKDLFDDLPSLRSGEEMHIAKYSKPANEYLKKTLTRNGQHFTTQHVTRKHNDRDLEIYSIAIDKWINERSRLKYNELPSYLRTHKNMGGFLDRFKVVDPIGHSHTMMAHIAKDGHYYIYPDLEQVRSLSVREAARIQSFPDDYFFEGGRTAAFKQIGNAVPPLMAASIAKAIKSMTLTCL